MIKPMFILLTVCLFSCCQSNEVPEKHRDVVTVEDSKKNIGFKFPVIIDTLKLKNVPFLKSISPFAYHVLYLGEYKNRILISYAYYDSPYSEYEGFRKNHRPQTASDMRLFVDTTQEIYGYDDMSSNIDPVSLSRKNVYHKAFPVCIVNSSADTLVVGWGTELQLMLDVKDKTGIWKPLHQWGAPMTGAQAIMLASNQVLVTSVPVFNGSFKTTFRVRYDDAGSIVSNEYSGSINPDLIKDSLDLF